MIGSSRSSQFLVLLISTSTLVCAQAWAGNEPNWNFVRRDYSQIGNKQLPPYFIATKERLTQELASSTPDIVKVAEDLGDLYQMATRIQPQATGETILLAESEVTHQLAKDIIQLALLAFRHPIAKEANNEKLQCVCLQTISKVIPLIRDPDFQILVLEQTRQPEEAYAAYTYKVWEKILAPNEAVDKAKLESLRVWCLLKFSSTEGDQLTKLAFEEAARRFTRTKNDTTLNTLLDIMTAPAKRNPNDLHGQRALRVLKGLPTVPTAWVRLTTIEDEIKKANEGCESGVL